MQGKNPPVLFVTTKIFFAWLLCYWWTWSRIISYEQLGAFFVQSGLQWMLESPLLRTCDDSDYTTFTTYRDAWPGPFSNRPADWYNCHSCQAEEKPASASLMLLRKCTNVPSTFFRSNIQFGFAYTLTAISSLSSQWRALSFPELCY